MDAVSLSTLVPKLAGDDVWLVDPTARFGVDGASVIVLRQAARAFRTMGKSEFMRLAETHVADFSLPESVRPDGQSILNTAEVRRFVNAQRLWKAGIELTTACTFSCTHCYQSKDEATTPSTDEVLSVIDELDELGVVWLWFTGGECTCRTDFVEIYRHAKSLGFCVMVLTNGSGLDDAVLDAFEALPPFKVKISQYGASREASQRVTGVERSHAVFRAAIDNLSARSITIAVQTVITAANADEAQEMLDYCRDRNLSNSVTVDLVPSLDGSERPLQQRSESSFLRETKDDVLLEFHASTQAATAEARAKAEAEGLFYCGAAKQFVFVTADLHLVPCLFARGRAIKVGSDGVSVTEAYDELAANRREILALRSECPGCEAVGICNLCEVKRAMFEEFGGIGQRCEEMKGLASKIEIGDHSE